MIVSQLVLMVKFTISWVDSLEFEKNFVVSQIQKTFMSDFRQKNKRHGLLTMSLVFAFVVS
jgi:hypothetical protein